MRFYASSNFLQVIGDTVGVDKSTISRAVQDVSQLLSAKQSMFIKWPTTAAVINENKNSFYRRRRFPGIILDASMGRRFALLLLARMKLTLSTKEAFILSMCKGSVTTKVSFLWRDSIIYVTIYRKK